MLKDIKMTVDIDETPIKLLLENDIQRIQEQILIAKSMKAGIIKLKDGTMIDRKAWVLESEKEMAKLLIELNKLKG